MINYYFTIQTIEHRIGLPGNCLFSNKICFQISSIDRLVNIKVSHWSIQHCTLPYGISNRRREKKSLTIGHLCANSNTQRDWEKKDVLSKRRTALSMFFYVFSLQKRI